jgi:hypothetical protein
MFPKRTFLLEESDWLPFPKTLSRKFVAGFIITKV